MRSRRSSVRTAPDLVVLQEATRPEVVERLAVLTSMATWGAKRGWSLGFLSRVALSHHTWQRPFLSRHAFLELALRGSDLRVIGVHLSAVHAAWTERRRTRELRALLAAIRAHAHGFHVLAGDFNTLAPGEELDKRRLPRRLRPFLWLSGGRIRWRTIHTVLEAGYADGWRLLHPEASSVPTFPTWDPHLRLDYVFIPSAFASRLARCEVVVDQPLLQAASDHLPLIAGLEIGDHAGSANVDSGSSVVTDRMARDQSPR